MLSIFSSSTFPDKHWQASTDQDLPEDSHIVLIPADRTDPHKPHILHPTQKRSILHPVVQLQSPTIHTTFLRCANLAITLDWLHLQLRPLGRRELAVEVGLIDANGTRAVVRAASFTTHPHLINHPSKPALLLLPLHLPSTDRSPSGIPVLTTWAHVPFHLPTLLSIFSSPNLDARGQPGILPSSQYARGASWSYVKVYANCRLRRVWFSADRAGGQQAVRGEEEFALYWDGEDQDG